MKHILLGAAICAWKGLMLPLLLLQPGTQDKEDMFDHCFGWRDPLLKSAWYRVLHRTEPRSHVLTNLVVEWNRLRPQRGAKAMLALVPLALVCGTALGLIF